MPIYMKYGDIRGDVTEPAYRGWIELQSFQWGVGRSVVSSTGGSASRESSSPSVSEIVVTKSTDSSTVHLRREALGGKGVPATIDFCRDDGSVYLRWAFENTLISGHSLSSGGDRPSESLTLNFTKVEHKYTPGTPP